MADLSELNSYEVVIFGSYVEGGFHPGSDVDVAVVTRDSRRTHNKSLYARLLGKVPPLYDLKIFELLPLVLKMAVITHHEVLFGNRVELSEYFYRYRKRWADCRHRVMDNQFTNFHEQRQARARGKRVIARLQRLTRDAR